MKRTILLGISLTVCLILGGYDMAHAYSIDGSVSDWGVTLSTTAALTKGYLDTNQPPLTSSLGTTIDRFTEDNADANNTWYGVGPGSSYQNYFDAEAIYFDNDQTYAYIAVVTGLPKGGYTINGYPHFDPGDIFIDIGSNNSYDYGIEYDTGKLYNLTGSTPLSVYYNGSNGADYTISNPWQINTSTATLINSPLTQLVYSNTAVNTHYVIEAEVPLSDLGLSGKPTTNLTIHWTMQCGNDYLNLAADYNPVPGQPPIPEPSSLLLLGVGLVGIAGRKLRRKI